MSNMESTSENTTCDATAAMTDISPRHYAPWIAWTREHFSSPKDETPLVHARDVTSDQSSDIESISATRLRTVMARHCMASFGFMIIRGLDLESRPLELIKSELKRLFSNNFVLHPQETDANLILELRPSSIGEQPHLPFHTDAGHFLGLLCIEPASVGGDSLLVSALTIHKQMMQQHPWLLECLYESWNFHRSDRPGPSHYKWPIFRDDPDFGLSCYFLPNTIRETAKRIGIPLSPEQSAALYAFERLLSLCTNQVQIRLSSGDFLILNNKKILHSRTKYVSNDLEERLLLRAWINLPRSELSHGAPPY